MKTFVKMIAALCLTCAVGCTLIACGSTNNSKDRENGAASEATSDSTTGNAESPTSEEATYDTPVEFDDLTIVIGSEISAATLENQFSDHNGETIIAFPISVTNNKNDTHGLNMFYISSYGPNGTQLDDISAFFSENDISFAGDARAGATIQSFIHVPYDGDGDYYLEFKSLSEKVEVKLPVALG